jgi:hypothetical protein
MLGWVGRFARPHRASQPDEGAEEESKEKEGASPPSHQNVTLPWRKSCSSGEKIETTDAGNELEAQINPGKNLTQYTQKNGVNIPLETIRDPHLTNLAENTSGYAAVSQGGVESDHDKDEEDDDDENAEIEELRYDAYGFSVGPSQVVGLKDSETSHRDCASVPSETDKQNGRSWDKHIERLPKVLFFLRLLGRVQCCLLATNCSVVDKSCR